MFNLITHAMVAYPPTVTDPRPHCVGKWVCPTASLDVAGGKKTISLTVFGLRRLTHNQRRYRQNLTNPHKTRSRPKPTKGCGADWRRRRHITCKQTIIVNYTYVIKNRRNTAVSFCQLLSFGYFIVITYRLHVSTHSFGASSGLVKYIRV